MCYAGFMNEIEELKTPERQRSTIGVFEETRQELVALKKKYNARSIDDVIRYLMRTNVILIPTPTPVRKRWESAAKVAGYPVEQWVAQRVEAALTFRADPLTIQRALKVLTNGSDDSCTTTSS